MAFEPSHAEDIRDTWNFFKQLAEARQNGRNPSASQLKEGAAKAQRIISITERYTAELEQAYQTFMSGSQVSDAQKHAFSESVEAAGGFASWLRQHAANVGGNRAAD
jgi:hypothetical protein